jgi:hypothetical protein
MKKTLIPALLVVASLAIIILAIEIHSKSQKGVKGAAPNVAPRPSKTANLSWFHLMKSKSLSHALDLIVPKVNEKAPALLSNLTQNVIKPLNLPKLIDPSGQGIALPIPSPWNTVVDAWIDNPLAGTIDSVLGPVLEAVGLNALELQNLLPAAGTCSYCIGSSPIHLFINNLKIKDVTGLESVKIIGHSITPPNALKLVVGVPKDTDIKVSLSGSLDLKHKCSKCAPLIGADDKNWKVLSSVTNLAVTLTLKKGELATACASYDLSSSVPLVVHTLAPSKNAQKPVLKISSFRIGKGNSDDIQALSGILKLFGTSEQKLVDNITAKVTGPLLKTALDAGKDAINDQIKTEVKSFCEKPPGPKLVAPLVKHLSTCKAQGKPPKSMPVPAVCSNGETKEKFYHSLAKLDCNAQRRKFGVAS